MKQLIILISFGVFSLNILAQNSVDHILIEVEKNNTSLSAFRESVEAEKIGNKTGIYLQNPEIEFNYLWGNHPIVGDRTDFNITQSFDFPSAYSYKNQISEIKNQKLEFEYQRQRQNLLLKTRLVCTELVYANALKYELSKQLSQAQRIADSYKSKFEIGETNILEFNKARLNELNLRKELEITEIERNLWVAELIILNGGIFIDLSDSVFQLQEIPVDFEQWYIVAEQNNPVLNWLLQEIELSAKQEKLNKAMSLPKLQTGYMSERIIGEKLQGITVGISIPLWENKNTVKYAKANSIATESLANDNKIQFYNRLKALHTKAISLQKNAHDYRQNLLNYDNSELLSKALDKGQISLIDYILELSIYYESIYKLLDIEREMNKTIAELKQYM